MPTPREMRETADRAQREAWRNTRLSARSAGREATRETAPSERNRTSSNRRTFPDERLDTSSSRRSASPERRATSSNRRMDDSPERGRITARSGRRTADSPERHPERNAKRRVEESRTSQPSGKRPQQPQTSDVRGFITRWRMYGVTAFSIIMVLGGLIGLLFFARPTSSAVEMRNLTEFPQITLESFLDGSFFTDVSLWYADTYPLREPMVAADHAVDSLFGVNTGSGMVGGNVKADEIPVEEQSSASNSEKPDFSPVVPPAAAPDERAVAEDIQANIMSGVYVTNGAGYSIYYFSQNAADTYITAMNTAAERLDGVATVYSIMAPANSITLPDEEALAVGGSDQQQALDYLSTRFDTRVKAVDLVDTIKEHRDEYVYFRTDHHWTQLGAYYAYVAFCKEKGIEPKSLSEWRSINLGEFRGTYTETVESMGYTAQDEVEAYIPASTNEMTYWTAYNEQIDGAIVDEEAATWDPSFKYSAFISGDRPLTIINNPKLDDGSSCLVVKDSYGCAFVPCLVDNYQTVHVIDFRETDKNICDYAIENNIQDVIFMTGMKIGLTDTVAQTLLAEVS